MIINGSTVSMSSEHSFYSHLEQKTVSMIMQSDDAAKLKVSEEGKALAEQMKDYKEEQKRQAKERQENGQKNAVEGMKELLAQERKREPVVVQSEEDIQIRTLKRILAMLNSRRKGKHLLDDIKSVSREVFGEGAAPAAVPTGAAVGTAGISIGTGSVQGTAMNGGAPIALPTWKKVTVTSAFYTEAEHTAFCSQGVVRTQDGRELTFDVQVEMSRAFCEKYESLVAEDYVCVDPLVFQLDGNMDSIGDQKFLFDLNADGTEEEISFTNAGSGFLALDKNKDGVINDGSELFGTKSGDGFADLAKYDEDGNGWIDEADEVFDDLTIWTLDAAGEKVQVSLKDADVGAIYLGSAKTDFTLKNADNSATNGVVRKTGIFLKESGGAGTVQHIDLAV